MSASRISTSEEATAKRGEASPRNEDGAPDAASVGSSAALISFFVIISRITGFARTWAMAFALGSTVLASSYQVANNLPNMLYELVVGGMLVTAFLPVYVSVRNKLGSRGGNEYAGNLLSLTFIFLGLVALACTCAAPALILTQSYMTDQSTMGDAIFFFRFFAVQIVFYGISTIVSGLLNASRDYLWSSAAPIFNNVIVAATFIAYAFVAPHDAQLAKYIIAIGNPLGVFVQMAIQLPALRRNGIRLRFHVNLRDPALKETLSIGVPAIVVMFMGMIIVSVQNAASYTWLDNGPSVIAYARLWFTLPYAFLTVPITTTMFTEITTLYAQGNMKGFKQGIISGTNQIVFFMVPFALLLIVFAEPLVTLYHIGAFTEENIAQIAWYLIALAASLPFYAVNTYLQKAFSALRSMKAYAVMMVAASLVQIGFIYLCMAGVPVLLASAGSNLSIFGLCTIGLSEAVFYLVLDVACFVWLRVKHGSFGVSSVVKASVRALALGLLGAAAGFAVSFTLQTTVFPADGSIPGALVRIFAGGLVAVGIVFGIAIKLNLPEAAFLTAIVAKVARKLHRASQPSPTAAALPDSQNALDDGYPNASDETARAFPAQNIAAKAPKHARTAHMANAVPLEEKIGRAQHAKAAKADTEKGADPTARARHAKR